MLAYLYYTYYKFTLVTPSKEEMPELIANTTLTLFPTLNVIVIFIYLQSKKVFFANTFLNNKIYVIFIFIFFWILGYFLFVRKGKHLVIKEKFDKESKKAKYIKMGLVIIYTIVSFVLPIVMSKR